MNELLHAGAFALSLSGECRPNCPFQIGDVTKSNAVPFSSIKGTLLSLVSGASRPVFSLSHPFSLFLSDARGSAILIGVLSLPGCRAPRESPILVSDADRRYFGLRNHQEDTISRGPASLAAVIAGMNRVVCVYVFKYQAGKTLLGLPWEYPRCRQNLISNSISCF